MSKSRGKFESDPDDFVVADATGVADPEEFILTLLALREQASDADAFADAVDDLLDSDPAPDGAGDGGDIQESRQFRRWVADRYPRHAGLGENGAYTPAQSRRILEAYTRETGAARGRP